ncbi:uncharacterized protein LOC116851349 isoform X3 [Odontomachus brunneus]|uniref:uncharacterized protein LOC116851349 isoform X3 n=1 Tax=Odontomachus brunneus TaxID=486640 RepID=UPI0013F24325|nr:uncharacterized protein LOC116851349 isoform X3 [Odontomachus brunneus]
MTSTTRMTTTPTTTIASTATTVIEPTVTTTTTAMMATSPLPMTPTTMSMSTKTGARKVTRERNATMTMSGVMLKMFAAIESRFLRQYQYNKEAHVEAFSPPKWNRRERSLWRKKETKKKKKFLTSAEFRTRSSSVV